MLSMLALVILGVATPQARLDFKLGDKVVVVVEEPSGTPSETGLGTDYRGEAVGVRNGGLSVDVKFLRNGREETKSPPVVFTTELTRLQRKILRLLGMSGIYSH
jgi:hypothetical protein